ncbi:MAG: hypothetical protein ACI3W8_02155 [Oscillospiraceae bacterium]
MEKGLVVSNDNNPRKAFLRALKWSVLCIVFGVAAVAIGSELIDEINYFSKDYEDIVAYLVFGFGVMAILTGVIYPFSAKKIAEKSVINVYEDHIEGKMAFTNFYETYDKIRSVTVIKNLVSVNLVYGNAINCTAYNAEQVAKAIRERIV